MKKADRIIISELRKNSSKNIVDVANSTGIPLSTLYDRLNAVQKKYVKRNSSLVDFRKLGYPFASFTTIKVDETSRKEVADHLNGCKNINSIYKLNFGSKYMIETVFRNLTEYEQFLQKLKALNAEIIMVNHINEEITKERFLTEQSHFESDEDEPN